MKGEDRTGQEPEEAERYRLEAGIAAPQEMLLTPPAGIALPPGVQEELQRLQELTFSDMAALAWISDGSGEQGTGPYVWASLLGSRSERVQRMSFRRGSPGLAGTALRLGRYVTAEPQGIRDFARECPVMLAEKLQTALALPVNGKETAAGVLLLGSRSGRLYGPEEIRHAQSGAQRIF
ncbi:GAF domain-containing protein [Paenibacillus filicis]|uniref:GAF domain-containing protein n=1 Tax=Paenibacillus filicis TaxID=669464 RepID=A0ABU9DM83_9BACL